MEIIVNESVVSLIESLQPSEMAKVLRTIDLLEQFGPDLGLPHSRHMTDGLLELRIRGKRELRIFYCFYERKTILLHGFIKKTQKTPTKEIFKARQEKENLH